MSRPTLDNEVMFPTEYLAAGDFAEGQDVSLTIKDIKAGQVVKTKKGKEKHTILYFEKTDKKLILKPTNAGLIAAALGETEARKWAGRKITLYRTTCDAFGDPHKPCVRVRETAPNKPATKSNPAQQQDQSGDNAGANCHPSGAGAPDVLEQLDKILAKSDVDYQDYGLAMNIADPDSEFVFDDEMEKYVSAGDHYAAVRWIKRRVVGDV